MTSRSGLSMVVVMMLVGCGGSSVTGDWYARTASADGGDRIAVGTLEIDRDGETELDLDVAGGVVASLDASGIAIVDGTRATLSVVGELDGAPAPVAVEGSCERADKLLTCLLSVDGASWTFTFLRDPNQLVELD